MRRSLGDLLNLLLLYPEWIRRRLLTIGSCRLSVCYELEFLERDWLMSLPLLQLVCLFAGYVWTNG
jgi:hypothetical protein